MHSIRIAITGPNLKLEDYLRFGRFEKYRAIKKWIAEQSEKDPERANVYGNVIWTSSESFPPFGGM